MLIHCPSCLGTASAVLATELQRRHRVLTMWARKRSHAVDQFDGVMSHSFKPSPLIRHDRRTKVTKAGICGQPVRLRSELVGGGPRLTLCRQHDGNRTRVLSPASLHLRRSGYNMCHLRVERRQRASGRVSIEF